LVAFDDRTRRVPVVGGTVEGSERFGGSLRVNRCARDREAAAFLATAGPA
jgi:hypothetical protein